MGCAMRDSGKAMPLTRMAVLPRAGRRISPGVEGCSRASAFGLANPAKIKGSVVSQRGRKDLQSGARRGFGDANPPPGGPN